MWETTLGHHRIVVNFDHHRARTAADDDGGIKRALVCGGPVVEDFMKKNATSDSKPPRAMQSSSSDPYEILNVPRGTTDEEVLKKAIAASVEMASDRNPEKRVEAEARFKKVSEAYETLKDPMKRQG